MKVLTWPTLNPGDQWLTAAMEKAMWESNQTPAEMRAQARKLRAEAAEADIKGIREACLTLAANYEQVAAERLAA
jgi:hypothetical protein